jgi:hypothetical protein
MFKYKEPQYDAQLTITGWKEHQFENEIDAQMEQFRGTTLLLFSGYQDKNSKEIYEGDILKDENQSLWMVKSDTRGLYVWGILGEESIPLREMSKFEIVSNLYLNPILDIVGHRRNQPMV